MEAIIDKVLPVFAHEIAQKALPDRRVSKAADCLFYAAAAAAALRPIGGWRFVAGGAFLHDSDMMGWGLCVSPRDNKYHVTASTEVDEDGTYCGHCWVQAGRYMPVVIDVMSGYCGPRHSLKPLSVYHAIPKLTRSVSAFHRDRLRKVMNAARRDRDWVERLRSVADRLEKIAA